MVQSILLKLKESNARISIARKAVVSIFSEARTPLAAEDIAKKLSKKGVTVNKTTVYREIDFLVAQHIIHEVRLRDRKIRFELSCLPHHHHLVCLSCGDIDDFHMEQELRSAEQIIKQTKRFKVQNHSLEFFGLCAKCH